MISTVINPAAASPLSAETRRLRLIKLFSWHWQAVTAKKHHSTHILWGVNYICFLWDYVSIIKWFMPGHGMRSVEGTGSSEWSGGVKYCWAEFRCQCWWQVCDACKMTLCFPLSSYTLALDEIPLYLQNTAVVTLLYHSNHVQHVSEVKSDRGNFADARNTFANEFDSQPSRLYSDLISQ